MGNVDGRTLFLIGIPGGVGAFTGAVVLSNLSLDAARPWTSVVLLVLGAVILIRFIAGRRRPTRPAVPTLGIDEAPARHGWSLVPLGLVGGFLDASGGGGWGPVTTSTLMAAARMRPRTIIGTVSGSEFIVSIAASAGFLVALGSAGIDGGIVAMMLVGGAIAAPISAWLVSRIDERALGIGVGGLIIFLNVDRGLSLAGANASIGLALRLGVIVATLAIVGAVLVRNRARRIPVAADSEAG
jgi:uncharacterized membrane protein YfcA